MTVSFLLVITVCVMADFVKWWIWGTMDDECSARFACRHSYVPHLRLSVVNMLKQSTRRLMFIPVFLILKSDYLIPKQEVVVWYLVTIIILYFIVAWQTWLIIFKKSLCHIKIWTQNGRVLKGGIKMKNYNVSNYPVS